MVGGEESADAILIASEPLTRDSSSWIEVPEYGVLCVEMSATGHTLTTGEIRL